MPGRVADRWPSLRALLDGATIGLMAADCEGLPIPTSLGVGSTSGPALLAFASPSKIRSISRGPVALPSGVKACFAARPGPVWPGVGLLSWGCQISPLHRLQHLASTPGRRPRTAGGLRRAARWRGPDFGAGPEGRCASQDAAVTFGPEMPLSGLVPSLSFFPTSTVCSAKHLAGLLHPAADHGVRHVFGPSLARPSGLAAFGHLGRFGVPCGAHERRATALPSQQLRGAAFWRAHWRRCVQGGVVPRWRQTLRSFPLASSRAVSPRPLPSRRWALSRSGFRVLPVRDASLVRPGSRPRPQGFAPLTSPLRSWGVSTAKAPDTPLGFAM